MADEEDGIPIPDQIVPPPSNRNPLLIVLVIANCLGLGSIAFLQYSAFQKDSNRPSVRDIVKAQIKEELGDMGVEDTGESKDNLSDLLLPLEGFTANLAQGDGPRRYVRLNIVLKFSKDSKEEEFKARKPQIRDSVISILNSKRPEDLLKAEGKTYLKQEMKAAVNSFLVDGHVKEVYYVGFQIN